MTQNNNNYGIGFTGLLTIAFVVLKLTNVIDWSWWWIIAPILAPFVLVMIFAIIMYFIVKFSNRN